jgi:hypothetical protein
MIHSRKSHICRRKMPALIAAALLASGGSSFAAEDDLLAKLMELATKHIEALTAISEVTEPVREEVSVKPAAREVGLVSRGLQTSAGLSSAARGLTTEDDWRRMFPRRSQP